MSHTLPTVNKTFEAPKGWSTPEPWTQQLDPPSLASFRDFRSCISAVNSGQGGRGLRGAVAQSSVRMSLVSELRTGNQPFRKPEAICKPGRETTVEGTFRLPSAASLMA